MYKQAHKKPKVLLDLSTSFQWGARHAVGVVRVERELAARFLNDPDMDVTPVVWHEGALHVLDQAYAIDLISVDIAPNGLTPSHQQAANQDGLRPSVGQHIRLVTQRQILRFFRWGEATAGLVVKHLLKICPSSRREALFTRIKYFQRSVKNFLRTKVFGLEDGLNVGDAEKHSYLRQIVQPNSENVLLITGLSTNTYNWDMLSELKQKSGLRIATFSHDFLPVKFPKYFPKGSPEKFHNFSIAMMKQSDIVFCISKCSQRDLQDFCARELISAPPSTVVILGASIASPADKGAIALPLQEKLEKGRFGLSVGTFEIRKNYAFLISLWEELLTDPNFDLDLVIVGKPGWLAEKTIARLERSPHFGDRIIWFRNMPDAGLSWLYDKCQVFLFPSHYEGWGLPVVEALQHGRPAIISNRGSVPEAGLGVATVLDTDDRAAWLREVRRHAAPERSVLEPKPILPTWEETAATVKESLLDLYTCEARNQSITAEAGIGSA